MLVLEKLYRWLAMRMNQLGMTGIVFVTILICTDVFCRIVYEPIKGVYDLVQFVTGSAIAFTVPYTILSKGNVVVSLIVDRFPARYQDIIESVTLFFSIMFFTVITSETIRGCMTTYRLGEVTPTIGIPRHYLFAMIAFGFAMGGLRLLMDFINTFRKAVAK